MGNVTLLAPSANPAQLNHSRCGFSAHSSQRQVHSQLQVQALQHLSYTFNLTIMETLDCSHKCRISTPTQTLDWKWHSMESVAFYI